MAALSLRTARAADAAAIAAIWNPVIADTAITFTTALKTPDGIAADIARRGALFRIAEEDGVLAGFATCAPFRSGPGYARTLEHSIQLAPGARGRGIGRRLMQDLERVAQECGAHSLMAGISGENPGAVAFHTALGFAQVARLPEVGFKFGRWMDLVLMQKFLDFPP